MHQAFRDLCRDAYRRERTWGLLKVWLRVLADTGVTAVGEHAAQFAEAWRRSKMEKVSQRLGANPAWTLGMLISVVLIAAGILANAWLARTGQIVLGTAFLLTANLAAGVIMDAFTGSRGAVTLGMLILFAGALVPMLWVEDSPGWLRENPVNGGLFVILSTYGGRGRAWVILAVALILGGAHVLISLI
jgi:hypothetical protein